MTPELKEKSLAFALRMVKLYRYLSEKKKEQLLSRQVFRSGTAIGILVREAELCPTEKERAQIIENAVMKTAETEYWISLLKSEEYITDKMLESIEPDIQELYTLLKAAAKPKKAVKKKTSAAKKK
jgi:four helix bundle protein